MVPARVLAQRLRPPSLFSMSLIVQWLLEALSSMRQHLDGETSIRSSISTVLSLEILFYLLRPYLLQNITVESV